MSSPGWSTEWSHALPTRSAAEREALLARAREAVRGLQSAAARASNSSPQRAFHAASPYATTTARLTVAKEIAPELRTGFFVPESSYRAIVRFSNASPVAQRDSAADQRGIAVRVVGDQEQFHDLLMTSGAEAHHAKDAEALIASIHAAAAAVSGGAIGKVRALLGLMLTLGPHDGLRLAQTPRKLASSGVSLAAEEYFSRSPFTLGPYVVKLRLRPMNEPRALTESEAADALGSDFIARRRARDVRFHLEAHGFLDRSRTPLDDHRVAWSSAWITLGELVFPRAPGASADIARGVADHLTKSLGFSPHNQWTPGVLDPLGDLNMLRAAYDVSVRGTERGAAASTCPLDPREA